ncbi:HK97 family phage prohead protease, partial [candidate division TA06 bacterium]|nr:HK97 family phage prohead protease [candidate division TA06 bacterium]
MIVKTIPDGQHPEQHEILFPDGVIPAGWYATNSINGHFHGVLVKEDLEIGDVVVLNTDLNHGLEQSELHSHEISIMAIPVQEIPDVEPALPPVTVETDAVHDPDDDEEDKRSGVAGVNETKITRHSIIEVKESKRNGVPVGIVSGYLSTWQPDTGGRFGVPDQFVPGAWAESLAEHRRRGDRQVRLKDHHGRTIGGFPIETVVEDERGLFAVGEINLESQAGREAYSLAKQRVLTDFSVGYVAINDKIGVGVRRIFKAMLLEASIVDEPGNQGANITEVKNRVSVDEAKEITTRELEKKLHESGLFSRAAARLIFHTV